MSLRLNTEQVKQRVKQGAVRGVSEAARVVEAAAVPLTPLGETGNLRQSAQAVPGTDTGGKVEGAVRYDGLPYIRRQHEETTWKHPRAGQAKYLETARAQNAERVAQIIRNHVKGTM